MWKIDKLLLQAIAIGTGLVFSGYLLLQWWTMAYETETATMEITIHNPSPGFQIFDPTSTRILAVGGLIYLSCWGISKVIKVWK